MDGIGGGRPIIVLGTRPEIIKTSHVARLLSASCQIVHTGQHEDHELAGAFLSAAGITSSATLCGISGESRHIQIGRMIEKLGAYFAVQRPSVVIVQGDTNSANAGAQAANYTGIPVIHIEAGLRSHDRAMPEELNRQVISVLADVHCAPTPLAVANLRAAGIPAEKIVLTGNTIVEAIAEMTPEPAAAVAIALRYGAEAGAYVLATIHRPENTDDAGNLQVILEQLGKLGLPVLVPLHPRTRQAVRQHGLGGCLDRLTILPPVDHETFLGLASQARLLISDSGGIQEECTVLKRPLIVVRNSTERPEAIESGFAWLVRPGPRIGELGRDLLADDALLTRLTNVPSPFGDGRASERIAVLAQRFLRAPMSGEPGLGLVRRWPAAGYAEVDLQHNLTDLTISATSSAAFPAWPSAPSGRSLRRTDAGPSVA